MDWFIFSKHLEVAWNGFEIVTGLFFFEHSNLSDQFLQPFVELCNFSDEFFSINEIFLVGSVVVKRFSMRLKWIVFV